MSESTSESAKSKDQANEEGRESQPAAEHDSDAQESERDSDAPESEAEAAPDSSPESSRDGHANGHGDHHGENVYPYVAHHFDSPKQQFDAGKLGIWLFLVTEILFFAGLFCAYTIYRAQHPEVFYWAHFYLDTKLGALNTIVLILSSLTAAWAVRCAQTGQKRGLIINIVITFVCASTFMVVKYVEYSHKFHDGLLPGAHFKPAQEVYELEAFKEKHPESAAAAQRLLAIANAPDEAPAAQAAPAPGGAAPTEGVAPTEGAASTEGAAPTEGAAKSEDTTAQAEGAAKPEGAAAAAPAGQAAAAKERKVDPTVKQAEPAAPAGATAAQPAGVAAAGDTPPEPGKAAGTEAPNTAAEGAPAGPTEASAVDPLVKAGAEEGGGKVVGTEQPAVDAPPTAEPGASEAPADPALGNTAPVVVGEALTKENRLALAISQLKPEEAKPLVDAGVIRDAAEGPVELTRPSRAHVFFSIYFFMTGLHGIHVLVGMGIWIWLLLRAIKGQFGPLYFGPIDFAALYWHLVDLIWIYLFPLLYLIH